MKKTNIDTFNTKITIAEAVKILQLNKAKYNKYISASGAVHNFYNAGLYGWNFSIYIMNNGDYILTGYKVPKKLIDMCDCD